MTEGRQPERASGGSRAPAVCAPPLPLDHPLVALVVLASSKRGLSGPQWQLFQWPQLVPFAPVFKRLRADVDLLHATPSLGSRHAVQQRTAAALAELAEVVAEHFPGRDAELRRFIGDRIADGPLVSRATDDKRMNKLIRQEQNRIDHRNRRT
ncbi:hypothetical protein [Nocardia asteroides]|uniref:hypothetical protein n=1 Tax=Nocardia asteroides TaxID=1824 RepID=UPI001E3893CD|nr:hypothetical protein [Nocardia asteroides]UGT63946.1 hypothetical protein LTT61_11840 [Nocardia asteroides]